MTSALGDSCCSPHPSPLLASLPLWDPGNSLRFSPQLLLGLQMVPPSKALRSPLLWGPRSFLG